MTPEELYHELCNPAVMEHVLEIIKISDDELEVIYQNPADPEDILSLRMKVIFTMVEDAEVGILTLTQKNRILNTAFEPHDDVTDNIWGVQMFCALFVRMRATKDYRLAKGVWDN